MEVKDEILGDLTIVHLKGKLDSSAAQEFYAEMLPVIGANSKRYLFEMSEVDLVDSTGLGTLVRIYKRIIESEGALRLSNLKPFVLEVFEFTGLDCVFQIYGTTEEALTSFSAHP